jgi:multisubunit Na+/H+ antiporter MnhB subunit
LADTLIASADIGVVVAFGLALLYLVVGLVRPSWAWATKRRSVVLRSLGLMLLSLVGFAGAIGYSLTLPDNPHSIDRYLKDYDFEQSKKQAPDNGQQ